MATPKNLFPSKPTPLSAMKRQLKASMQKEIERLQAENHELKTNPEGLIGKFLAKFDEAVVQNNRLSAAICGYMKENGGTMTVNRDTIDTFVGSRLVISLQNNEEAGTYTFSYVAEVPSADSVEVPATVEEEAISSEA